VEAVLPDQLFGCRQDRFAFRLSEKSIAETLLSSPAVDNIPA
jgi:hypothetical protein